MPDDRRTAGPPLRDERCPQCGGYLSRVSSDGTAIVSAKDQFWIAGKPVCCWNEFIRREGWENA